MAAVSNKTTSKSTNTVPTVVATKIATNVVVNSTSNVPVVPVPEEEKNYIVNGDF